MHRRAADKNGSKKAYGETVKLLGNSYYGKCLTNIEKHRQVQYGDKDKAAHAINKWRFRTLQEINDDCYEIQLAKKRCVIRFQSTSICLSMAMLNFVCFNFTTIFYAKFYHSIALSY